MIRLLRVDSRLIHGQVAVSWTSFLGINCIVVPSDLAAKDQFTLMTMKLAKPPGVDLFIESIDSAIEHLNRIKDSNKKIFIVTQTVEDALKVVEKVEGIEKVSVGSIKMLDGKKKVNEQIFIDERDIEILEKIYQKNIIVECQSVPTTKVISFEELKSIHKRNK